MSYIKREKTYVSGTGVRPSGYQSAVGWENGIKVYGNITYENRAIDNTQATTICNSDPKCAGFVRRWEDRSVDSICGTNLECKNNLADNKRPVQFYSAENAGIDNTNICKIEVDLTGNFFSNKNTDIYWAKNRFYTTSNDEWNDYRKPQFKCYGITETPAPCGSLNNIKEQNGCPVVLNANISGIGSTIATQLKDQGKTTCSLANRRCANITITPGYQLN